MLCFKARFMFVIMIRNCMEQKWYTVHQCKSTCALIVIRQLVWRNVFLRLKKKKLFFSWGQSKRTINLDMFQNFVYSAIGRRRRIRRRKRSLSFITRCCTAHLQQIRSRCSKWNVALALFHRSVILTFLESFFLVGGRGEST